MTVRDQRDISEDIARLWAGRDLDAFMNSAVRALSVGTATDWGMSCTFRGHQAEVVGVPMDAEGLDLDALTTALEGAERDGKRVKLIYTIANFQNPTGLLMSATRREVVLRLASEHGVYLLDDDA